MRRSIMKSMIAGCMAVLVITFILVTPVFFISVQNDEINKEFEDMENTIDHVKPLAAMSLNFNTQKMYRLFDESMKQYSYFTNSDILFIDKSGTLVWSNRELNIRDTEQDYINRVYKNLINNKRSRIKGLLNGLYMSKTLTVCEYVTNENGEEIYMILYTRKIPAVAERTKTVIIEFLVVEVFAMVFMAGFMYMFSRRITGPLKKINRSVTEFSNGNFRSRVKYKSENELGELATNINDMADNIENLEKTRAMFISDVSHELRTPMTTISGFVEGVLDGTISEENREKYLKIVLSESKRLSRLVNDLLNVSRIDSGKVKIEKINFDIVETAKVVLLKFEEIITSKNLDVSFEADMGECIVYADKDGMIQVLTNLIHNAAKFTPENGYIKIRIFENKVGKCVVSVMNDGPGIRADKLNHIWDRFYKADESRSSDKSGVGLGLYIVKRIINAHEEKIYAESIPGKQTEFYFTVTMGK